MQCYVLFARWRFSGEHRDAPFNKEYYDANRKTAGIEEGAQDDRYPLQPAAHSAARKGQASSPSGSRLANAGSPGAIRKSVSGSPNGSPDAMQPSWLTITPDKGALRGLPVQPSVPFFLLRSTALATGRIQGQDHRRPIGQCPADRGQRFQTAFLKPRAASRITYQVAYSGHIFRICDRRFHKPLKNIHFRASSRDSSRPTQ